MGPLPVPMIVNATSSDMAQTEFLPGAAAVGMVFAAMRLDHSRSQHENFPQKII